MDRSLQKVLGLPIFDDVFRDCLELLKTDRIEFWMALADDETEPPDQKLSSVLPALTSKEEISDLVLKRLDMVCTLSMLVKQLAPNIKREIATDLGYGSAEVSAHRGKRALDPSPPAVHVAKAVGARPAGAGPTDRIFSCPLYSCDNKRKQYHQNIVVCIIQMSC